ncbi:hypothetical protein [Croceibacterium ferulae]|uniref:hypothetical protein n=1 Tax=Croceibacterium ferulae TaxID=1854641 RepID=UPI000F896275|nr:hypothetical protein [Croceibacterium ferulae]
METNASGQRDNHSVMVKSQVGRIDCVLTATGEHANVPSGGPPRINDVEAATALASSYLYKLTGHLKVIRVALVLDLATTVQRGSEIAAMKDLVHPLHLPDQSIDVVLQFNVRRPFELAPGLMNRLVTWTSGQVGYVQVTPGVMMGTPMVMTPYVGLKIDANSAPETPFDQSHLEKVIEELQSECLAIYVEGASRFLT